MMNTNENDSSIDRHYKCVRCGYELFGLSPGGTCPECGTLVERSYRGDLLEYCDEPYLASLHSGAFWVQISIVIATVNIVLRVLFFVYWIGLFMRSVIPGGSPELIDNFLSSNLPKLIGCAIVTVEFLATTMMFIGWRRISVRDPGQLTNNRGQAQRRFIHIATRVLWFSALAQFALTLAYCLSGLSAPQSDGQAGNHWMMHPQSDVEFWLSQFVFYIGLLATVVWIAAYYGALNYIRWLAPRIPNIGIFRSAGRLRWLGPLVYIVGFIVLNIGPIIAMTLYFILINRLRRDLKAIRAKMPGAVAAA